MYSQRMGQVRGRVMVSVHPDDGSGKGRVVVSVHPDEGSGKGKGDGECTARGWAR